MSVREVTALRKEGRLKDAYDLALSELEQDQNKWTITSMFWVLRDLCKQDIAQNDTANAQARLAQMETLLSNIYDDVAERAYESLVKQITPFSAALSSLSELSKSDATEAYNKAVAQFGKSAENLSTNLHEDFAWIIYRFLKSNLSQLSSIQVRTLLRDYMSLNNPRPSTVHSMILNFALNFAKENKDFIFFNFLKLWGIQNLRFEDFHDGNAGGRTIPSLVSRIMRVFAESQQPINWQEFIQLLENNPNSLYHEELIDLVRQQKFWQLINLQKTGQWEKLWTEFEAYANTFAEFGPSVWHSEILKIALRFMDGENAWRFMPFAKKWNVEYLRRNDWRNEVGKDGNEYKSLAVKTAKKCFETIKALNHKPDEEDIRWVQELYSHVLEHDNDEWNLRNYATIHLWLNENEKAIKIYKKLLAELNDKFYIWSELADCIQDNDDLKIGLLLKAKSTERNEDFIGDVHLDLAELWIKKGYKKEAGDELQMYADNRQKKNWNISDRYKQLSNNLNNLVNGAEISDYKRYIAIAENYAFDEYDWKEFVLVDKWEKDNKQYCKFFDGNDLNFSIKSRRFAACQSAKLGDILKFKVKIVEKEIVPSLPSSRLSLLARRNTEVKKMVTPLVAAKTDVQPWSILPQVYGYVDYDNEAHKALHIISQASHLAFWHYKKHTLKKGDFVTFREICSTKNETTTFNAEDVKLCSREEAIPHFKRRIVIVDNINIQKNLFHIVLGIGETGDIIKFDETPIRPHIGDFLELVYCLKINKIGKKHIIPLSIQQTDETNEMRKSITGLLTISFKENKYFAFVNDYYVHGSVLDRCGINNDCEVTADIVYSSDGKWRVYNLNRLD